MNKNCFFVFLQKLINIANQISNQYFRCNALIEEKADQSPVTIADREIEKLWRQLILQNFPSHSIIGEEFGNLDNKSKFVWILDPIDGTSSFIVGKPIFGNLIALSYCNQIVFSLVNQPILQESWVSFASFNENYGNKKVFSNQNWQKELGINIKNNSSPTNNIIGKNPQDQTVNQPFFGSYFIKNIDQIKNWQNFYQKAQKCQTNFCPNLSQATIISTSYHYFENNLSNLAMLNNLRSKSKYQKAGGIFYGGDCYSYAMMALGFGNIVLDATMKIYDYAALIPLISMAGGKIVNFSGNEIIASNSNLFKMEAQNILAVSNLELLENIFS